jgi:hypothetical protein
MSKKTEKKRSETATNEGPSGLLYPFLQNSFSRGVLIALVPANVACIISRAPQFRLDKILGYDLPISFDAISLILTAPLYFLVVTWLLLRSAQRSDKPKEMWSRGDIAVFRGMVAFLGITAIFMLAQFFLVLAPAGTCPHRPHWELLWTIDFSLHQAEHCMSSAVEINKTAWYYVEPIILQAWVNIVLIGLSLYLLWQAWKSWISKHYA